MLKSSQFEAGQFEAGLKADGYVEIETKDFPARPANGEHGHHFSVRGLILDGEFLITTEGKTTTYRPGDVFAVAEGQLHCEAVGENGVRLVVGRKY